MNNQHELLQLLKEAPAPNTERAALDVAARMEDLQQAFAENGIAVAIGAPEIGPRLVRLPVIPLGDTTPYLIRERQDIIAPALRVFSVRVLPPEPAEDKVILEFQHGEARPVPLRSLLEHDAYQAAANDACFPVGVTAAGQPIYTSLSHNGSIFVSGASGMGKSVLLQSVLVSLLLQTEPDMLRLLLVDTKQVEFDAYNGLPQLLTPVITRHDTALAALLYLKEELERRSRRFREAKASSVEEYREKTNACLPRLLLVIDELYDMYLGTSSPSALSGILQSILEDRGRHGIHLLTGTCRHWNTMRLPFDIRISLKLPRRATSLACLGEYGAEALYDRGDMLLCDCRRSNGYTALLRLQSPYVSEEELAALTDAIRASVGDCVPYDKEVISECERLKRERLPLPPDTEAEDEEAEDGDGEIVFTEKDIEQLRRAYPISLSAGRISTSLLQRRLMVGYGRAAWLLEALIAIGVVQKSESGVPVPVASMQEFESVIEDYE